MPLKQETDKETIVHPHNGIPLSNKREQIRDTCSNMDTSQIQYAKWKKTESKDCIPW